MTAARIQHLISRNVIPGDQQVFKTEQRQILYTVFVLWKKHIADPNLDNASADLDPGIFMRIWFRIPAEIFFTFIHLSERRPQGTVSYAVLADRGLNQSLSLSLFFQYASKLYD
jgi:hypothetical protein